MEKRKPNDSMAAVKAAAWAWYQHGSGSEAGNTAREYDATRRRYGPPRPSRYKLEAMRLLAKNKSQKAALERSSTGHDEPKAPPHHGNLPLLDEYEIRSISRQLDSLVEYSRIANYDILREKYVSSSDDDSVASTSTSTTTTTTTTTAKISRNMKRMLMGGFWMRHAAAACGASDGGAVETATTGGFRHSHGVSAATRRILR